MGCCSSVQSISDRVVHQHQNATKNASKQFYTPEDLTLQFIQHGSSTATYNVNIEEYYQLYDVVTMMPHKFLKQYPNSKYLTFELPKNTKNTKNVNNNNNNNNNNIKHYKFKTSRSDLERLQQNAHYQYSLVESHINDKYRKYYQSLIDEKTEYTINTNDNLNVSFFDSNTLDTILNSIIIDNHDILFGFYCNQELSFTSHWSRDSFKSAITKSSKFAIKVGKSGIINKIGFYCIPEILSKEEWTKLLQSQAHGGLQPHMTYHDIEKMYQNAANQGTNQMTQQIKAIRESLIDIKLLGGVEVPIEIVHIIVNFAFRTRQTE